MLRLVTDDEPRRPIDEYALIYDDGRENEFVLARTPSEAVLNRASGYGSLLPHTVINLTIMSKLRERIDANKEESIWLR